MVTGTSGAETFGAPSAPCYKQMSNGRRGRRLSCAGFDDSHRRDIKSTKKDHCYFFSGGTDFKRQDMFGDIVIN